MLCLTIYENGYAVGFTPLGEYFIIFHERRDRSVLAVSVVFEPEMHSQRLGSLESTFTDSAGRVVKLSLQKGNEPTAIGLLLGTATRDYTIRRPGAADIPEAVRAALQRFHVPNSRKKLLRCEKG